MKIAVLSGKGGTGKTLVAVNLACVARRAVYADCDVEEPNGHLFFKPEVTDRREITVPVPEFDMEVCTRCRECVDFCRHNALALVKERMLTFYEMCHSCGGCALLCPAKAISEKPRAVGVLEEGRSEGVTLLTGCMNTGEASGVPVIKALLARLPREGTVLIDCPPGSGCMVMESIRAADYCLLVAEPTPFGLHNLAMVYELVMKLGKPMGVVLNKCLPDEDGAGDFCAYRDLPVLDRMAYDKELGKLNAGGRIAARENEEYAARFAGLLEKIKGEAGA